MYHKNKFDFSASLDGGETDFAFCFCILFHASALLLILIEAITAWATTLKGNVEKTTYP